VYLLFGFKIPLAASVYEVTTFIFHFTRPPLPRKCSTRNTNLHFYSAFYFSGARSHGGIRTIRHGFAHHHGTIAIDL